MDKLQLQSYKNRLLDAGIPYAVMRRNLRELRDHHDDLLRQVLANGMKETEAQAAAARQLGNSEQLVNAMLARPELRSKLHHYPRSMTILLPLFAHWVICLLLLLAFLFPAVITGASDQIDRANGMNSWLISVFEWLQLTLMYLIPPLLGCYVTFMAIRNHVPPRFWITGLILLCVLSGSLHVGTDWGDLATGHRNSLSVGYFPGFRQSPAEGALNFVLRFSVNLLLCGAFARAYSNKEQTAVI